MPGRGGGRGGGARGPLPRDVQISKKLSWLLRHGAEKEGLELNPGGYINVQAVLSNRNFKSLHVTFAELRQVVHDNDKQRYTLIPADGQEETSTDAKDYLIRANQGHSLKVASDALLKPITAENAPGMAVHGTTHAAWPRIVGTGGLKPMTRNHVHFASGLPAGFESLGEGEGTEAAAPVISGMRSVSTVLMFLDLTAAMEAGLKFGMSDNGVVLTEGDAEGIVPLRLFKSVVDRTGQGTLLQDGKIVKEAPVSWASKGGGKK